MNTYIIEGKQFAGVSLAQAMFAARRHSQSQKLKARPLTTEQERQRRRTQYHA